MAETGKREWLIFAATKHESKSHSIHRETRMASGQKYV